MAQDDQPGKIKHISIQGGCQKKNNEWGNIHEKIMTEAMSMVLLLGISGVSDDYKQLNEIIKCNNMTVEFVILTGKNCVS